MTLEGIKDLIENQLNANANAKAFSLSFKIFNEVGDFEEQMKNGMDSDLIYGVLVETSGDFTPVKEISSKFMSLRLDFAVKQENVGNFKIVLDDWSEMQLGIMYRDEESNKTYILTPSAPSTGTAFNTSDLGSAVPISVVLEVQATSNGLIGNESVWKINNSVVNVLRFKILSTRTQQTFESTNQDETKSANQMATQSFMLVIPVAKTDICKKLYNDIINNNKDEIYSIKMEDGFSDGIDADYILSSGEIDGESTKVGAMTCTFLLSNEDLE